RAFLHHRRDLWSALSGQRGDVQAAHDQDGASGHDNLSTHEGSFDVPILPSRSTYPTARETRYLLVMSELFTQQLARDLATAVANAAQGVVFTRGRRGRAASGTIIDAQSVVLSDHLLDADHQPRIHTANGEASSRIVGRDAGTDLALVQVEGTTLT